MTRFTEAVEVLESLGAKVTEISCPHFKYALPAYYLIAPSEVSSNLARFDGMRYGLRVGSGSAEEVMAATREAGFGAEAKRRIMLGTYALSSGYYDAYYGKAQQVRTLIIRDFDAAFGQVDVLISPPTPTTAFGIGERADDPMAMYLADLCTIPSNLAGNAAISVPVGLAPEDGLPVGLQVMAPPLADDRLYRVAAAVEAAFTERRGHPLLDRGEGTGCDDRHATRRRCRSTSRSSGSRRTSSSAPLTKMFCGCSTTFGAEPNTHTCPVCLGLPGSLPVVNERAIEYAIKIGLALNCSIAAWCRFARKNYFYPDMPKNFQISQYDEPLCTEGYLDVAIGGKTVRVGIERVHLEEDTGKSLHVGGATGRIQGAEYSLVDYNRAGIPLVEIVTKPVPGTGYLAPEVARAYVTELRDVLRSLGVSDVRMEEGSMRCDVNTSITWPASATGARGPRPRTSTRCARSSGRSGPRSSGRPGCSTRAAGSTGDPSLPRGHRGDHLRPVEGRGAGLPLLPRARPGAGGARRGLGEVHQRVAARAAVGPPGPADRGVVAVGARIRGPAQRGRAGRGGGDRGRQARPRPTRASGGWASWPGGPTTPASRSPTCRSPPADVARISALVAAGTLNDRLARQVIDGVLDGEGTPDEVVAARGLAVVSDDSALLAAIDEAIAANPDVVAKIRDGKVQAAGVLVGAVMKATRGQADAARVKDLILERLA